MIITIDGPVATGKSTIARKLAESVGYIYYDTGAMYRAVTFDLLRKNISIDDPAKLAHFLDNFYCTIKTKRGEKRYYIDDEDVTDFLRTEEVSKNASLISANGLVREKMVSLQRELSKGVNAVFEGRDMGTTVFPDAGLKIFLTGRDEVRAKRRFDELLKKYPDQCANLTLEKVLEDLRQRDQHDMTRQNSPLRKAEDAFEIDTSDSTIDQIVYKILEAKDIASARKKKQAPHK